MLQPMSFDSMFDRQLHALAVQRANDLGAVPLPPGPFACLVAWDAAAASEEEIESAARALLRAGCAYAVCWGPDCERAHDAIDRVVCLEYAAVGLDQDALVMTTWHPDEPLAQALWFLLRCAWTSDGPVIRNAVAISVGSPAWAAEIAAALADPDGFVEGVLDDEE